MARDDTLRFLLTPLLAGWTTSEGALVVSPRRWGKAAEAPPFGTKTRGLGGGLKRGFPLRPPTGARAGNQPPIRRPPLPPPVRGRCEPRTVHALRTSTDASVAPAAGVGGGRGGRRGETAIEAEEEAAHEYGIDSQRAAPYNQHRASIAVVRMSRPSTLRVHPWQASRSQ